MMHIKPFDSPALHNPGTAPRLTLTIREWHDSISVEFENYNIKHD